MKNILWGLLLTPALIAGCGSYTSHPQYATAESPLPVCSSGVGGVAVEGSWYCDQGSVKAMVSPSSDGNYTAYAAGTYNASQTGVSCTFTVSTIKTMDGTTTCYLTSQ